MKTSDDPAEVRVVAPKLALPLKLPVIRAEPSSRAVIRALASAPDPPALVAQA